MTLTPEETARKTQARKLIKMPIRNRPRNVLYQPATTFDFARYQVIYFALYQVIYGEIAVCFQHDGKRLFYLGEYAAKNFLKRMTNKATEVQKGDFIV